MSDAIMMVDGKCVRIRNFPPRATALSDAKDPADAGMDNPPEEEMNDTEKQQIKDTADQLEAGANRPVENQAAKMLRQLGKRVAELEHRLYGFDHPSFNEDRDNYE